VANLYDIMKGKAYSLATTTSGKGNADAKAAGFKDVFDYIMSDSDDPRHALFLMMLNDDVMVEGHRRILLDGMAQEYAGLPNWMAYVDRETKA
jgi:hypothetical protein